MSIYLIRHQKIFFLKNITLSNNSGVYECVFFWWKKGFQVVKGLVKDTIIQSEIKLKEMKWEFRKVYRNSMLDESSHIFDIRFGPNYMPLWNFFFYQISIAKFMFFKKIMDIQIA